MLHRNLHDFTVPMPLLCIYTEKSWFGGHLETHHTILIFESEPLSHIM